MADLLLFMLPPLALILTGILFFRKRQRIKREKEQARREAELDLVGCFTCGLKIPREGALEKKGRYFCGVKKAEREAAGLTKPRTTNKKAGTP
jgi:hypothetical protein